MNNDSPAIHDEFGRRPFATQLARAVSAPRQSPGGLVIALDGEWGSGKTTLLHWVKAELGKLDPAPVVLDFNPWRISGLDALVETFLIELAAKLETPLPGKDFDKGIEAGRRIVDYLGLLRHLRHLKYVPALSFVGNAVGDLADYADKAAETGTSFLQDMRKAFGKIQGIEGAKAAVESALDQVGRGVVVVLDDLDRLNREEIRTVFQLIKSIADFRHVTYLLAFDADQVARALDEGGDETEGRRYLEKIVQASFHTPPLFAWQANRHLDNALQQVLCEIGRELLPFERALWEKSLPLAAALCKQPRHLVRLSNHLRLSWAATKDAVNACDVLVFEALAQRLPKFARAIQEHPDEFTGGRFRDAYAGSYIDWAALIGDEQRQERWRRHLPQEGTVDRQLAEEACSFLFPYANKRTDAQQTAHWRIADINHLARLLQGCGLEGVPDAGEFIALFDNPSRLLSELEWMDVQGWKTWLAHARRYLPDQLAQPGELLKTLAHFAAKLFDEGLSDGDVSHGFSRFFLKTLFLQPEEARFTLLQRLISLVSCSFSEDVVFYSAWPHGLLSIRHPGEYSREEGPLLPDKEQALAVIDMWKRRASDLSEQGLLINEPELHSVLYRWTQLGISDYPPVWEAVERLCATREGLERFMSAYARDNDRELSAFALVWNVDALLKCLQPYPEMAATYAHFLTELGSDRVRRHLEKLKTGDVPEPMA